MSRNDDLPGLALRVSLFHIHALDGRVHLSYTYTLKSIFCWKWTSWRH